MTIEKLGGETPDITKQNIARLAELFPECVTEGSAGTASDRGEPVIDWDLLKQTLSDHLAEGPQERYRLDWPGKREALLTANAPVDKTLRPMREESVDFDTTRNLFIEGDNLDALKLLQETYLGEVKMIYIDPPYNTGKDFIYNDNYNQNREDYVSSSGQSDDERGRLVANPETNGRFHSDWLSMMFPRLKLARNLLRNDGVICVSLDDGEISNLLQILDETFGENNRIAVVSWHRKRGKDNSAAFFSRTHDHIIIYARDASKLRIRKLPLEAETIAAYTNRDNDERGPSRLLGLWARGGQGGSRYEFVNKNGERFVEREWLVGLDKMRQLDAENKIVYVGDKLYRKLFLSENDGAVPETIWTGLSNNANAADELKALFGTSNVFIGPKPLPLLERLIHLFTERDSLVLDFFAGSGTTGHALMAHNAEHGERKAFILVQLPEPISADAPNSKSAYDFCVKSKLAPSISSISRERIRRAGAKILEDKASDVQLDVGFRSFRIDSGSFHDVRITAQRASQDALAGLISHIRDDRTDEDLLFGSLLRWGVDITLPVKKREVSGRTTWFVDPPAEGEVGSAVIACFARPQNGKGGIDTELADAIAALKPLRVLFRDDGFATDAAKENVASRFKQLSPDTTLRVL